MLNRAIVVPEQELGVQAIKCDVTEAKVEETKKQKERVNKQEAAVQE